MSQITHNSTVQASFDYPGLEFESCLDSPNSPKNIKKQFSKFKPKNYE